MRVATTPSLVAVKMQVLPLRQKTPNICRQLSTFSAQDISGHFTWYNKQFCTNILTLFGLRKIIAIKFENITISKIINNCLNLKTVILILNGDNNNKILQT